MNRTTRRITIAAVAIVLGIVSAIGATASAASAKTSGGHTAESVGGN